MIVLPIVGFIGTGLLILYIHKIGVARLLRRIGHAFIAAGDAVDHWKERYVELNVQEKEVHG